VIKSRVDDQRRMAQVSVLQLAIRQLDGRKASRENAMESPKHTEQRLIEEIGIGASGFGQCKGLLHQAEGCVGGIDRFEQLLL
jgi:hypothetical protein